MKKSYIIFILFWGIFFIPNSSFGCGNEKHSCKKEATTTKAKEKSCCDTNNGDEGCKGKCGNSNCTTTSFIGFNLIIYDEIEFTNNNFAFSTSKSKFYHSENLLSDGFTSMWLIPKIS